MVDELAFWSIGNYNYRDIKPGYSRTKKDIIGNLTEALHYSDSEVTDAHIKMY